MQFDAGLAHLAGIDVVAAVVAGLVKAPGGPVGGPVPRRARRGTGRPRTLRSRDLDRRAHAHGGAAVGRGGVALLSARTVATSRGREITVLATAFLVEAYAG